MRIASSSVRPQGVARGRSRRLRAALVGLVVGAVALSGAAAVAPAEAAPSAPRVRLVPGDRALTAAWSAVPGATSYTVKLSRTRSLSHARVVTTSHRTLGLRKLTNGTAYYVGVTANRAVLSPSTVRSSVVRASAARGVPYPVSKVSVASGPGTDQVTVSWTGGGRAVKVGVIAGSSVLANLRPFHSAWYPATTRSIVLTVPAAYRPYIGAGTGNPVWVRVVQSNSSSSTFGASYSYDRKYRPSTPGTWAFAKAAPATGDIDKLTVAELNTQTVGATADYHAVNQWPARAQRVADSITTTSPAPDLLMTAELATNVLDGCSNTGADPYRCRSHTQVADLARRLPDLTLADTDAYDRVMDRMRQSPAWTSKVTAGAHIFYNQSKLTLLDHGFYSPAMTTSNTAIPGVEGLGVSPWDANGPVSADRWLSWAKFEIVGSPTQRQFYAVAAHFPVGDQQVVVDARAQETAKFLARIQERAGNLPIVFGGDVNSDATRSAKPVQPAFIRAGWYDAAAVASKGLRTGMKVSTANGSGPQDGADPGYGSRPAYHPYETSRIDYILLKNSPHTYSYANVLRLHSDGTFIKSLQGSDHNMQLAVIGIGDPATS